MFKTNDAQSLVFRKKGKLPGDCFHTSYNLEYGSAEVEIQKVGFKEEKGLKKALIVDDLLATGGTMEAAVKLIKECGAAPGWLES